MYPNPASDSVRLDFPTHRERLVSLYNIKGTKVLENISTGETEIIDIRSYPPGNYMLVINEGGVKESFKLQIIR